MGSRAWDPESRSHPAAMLELGEVSVPTAARGERNKTSSRHQTQSRVKQNTRARNEKGALGQQLLVLLNKT